MAVDDRTRYVKHFISPELWRRVKANAALEGKTVAQWLNELIEWAIDTKWKYEAGRNGKGSG